MRTCVYCGCTDERACPGGCHWIEEHEHTPTGVCSRCFHAAAAALLKMSFNGPRCIAHTEGGEICCAPATVLDEQRGGMVCQAHASTLTQTLLDLDPYRVPKGGLLP